MRNLICINIRFLFALASYCVQTCAFLSVCSCALCTRTCQLAINLYGNHPLTSAWQRLRICLISLPQSCPQVVGKAQQRKATVINIMSDYGVQVWRASSTQKHFLTTSVQRKVSRVLITYMFFLLFTMNMLILEVLRCVLSVSLKWQHVFRPKAFFVYNLHVFRKTRELYISVSHMQLTLERNSQMSPGRRQNNLGVNGKSAGVSVMWPMRLGFTGNSSSLEAVWSLSKVAHRSKHR